VVTIHVLEKEVTTTAYSLSYFYFSAVAVLHLVEIMVVVADVAMTAAYGLFFFCYSAAIMDAITTAVSNLIAY
jgi:hypothetical protein